MRLFNISSIEDSSRFGFEANPVLRAFAVVPRWAVKAYLRLTQSLPGHGAREHVVGRPATSIFEQMQVLILTATTPATPVATLGVLAGNYSLNVPAYLDTAMPTVSTGQKSGTGIGQRDCQVGQRDF